MLDHLSDEEIERYRRGAMPAPELLTANDHLATCESCYQRFGGDSHLEPAHTLLRTNLQETDRASNDHLLYEQMEAYIDDKLSREERENLESHLATCQECEMEISDLRGLKVTLSPERGSVSRLSPTLWGKPHDFWQSPVYRVALLIAGTAVIAIAFIWITTNSLRTRIAQMKTQMAELQQENEQLRQEYATAEITIAQLEAQLAEQSNADPSQNPSQRVLLSLKDDGGQVTLDGQGNLGGLKTLPPTYEEIIKSALKAQRVTPPPIIASLKGKPGRLMGEAGNDDLFDLISPVGTVTATDRPTFRWEPLGGASGYIVTVYDSRLKEVASSELLSAPEWAVTRPLRRGGIYTWQVRAIKDGKEVRMPAPAAPAAKFKVLEQAKAAELERAKQAYNGSHLILGSLYADAGLLDEAEQEFRALLDANPKSRVAQKLLESVNAIRR